MSDAERLAELFHAGLVGRVAFFAASVHLLGVVLGLGPAIGVAACSVLGDDSSGTHSGVLQVPPIRLDRNTS